MLYYTIVAPLAKWAQLLVYVGVLANAEIRAEWIGGTVATGLLPRNAGMSI